MIEALACGMPVVATPFGAAAEAWRTASAVSCDDLDGLTAALRDIDRIPAEACRARVESRFSADEMLGRYDRLFAMLAGGRGRDENGRGRSAFRLTVVAPRARPTALAELGPLKRDWKGSISSPYVAPILFAATAPPFDHGGDMQ